MKTKTVTQPDQSVTDTNPIAAPPRGTRFNRSPLAAGILAMGLCMGVASPSAQALALTEGSSACSGSETAKPAVNAALQSSSCANKAMTELYKSDFDNGAESGLFANAYDTTYSDLDADSEPATATVKAMGTDSPIMAGDYSDLWGLAKDGNNSPAWYGWDLLDLGWDGSSDLVFDSLWSNRSGAISHVSIFGTKGPTARVPAPGIVGLLGLGLIGLGLCSKRQPTA